MRTGVRGGGGPCGRPQAGAFLYCFSNPHGVGVKCPDDEINEQRILTAPAITLSDHRTVYDAKCGRPHWERGWSNADTYGQGGIKMGHFLRTSFMHDPKGEGAGQMRTGEEGV